MPFMSNQYYNELINIGIEKGIQTKVPTVMLMHVKGCSLVQRIYMTPGDTLTFRKQKVEQDTTKYYIKFSGKNSAHYNYNAQEDYALVKYTPRFIKGEGLDEYKNKIIFWKNKRLEFLEQYLINNTVSKDFLDYIRSDIQNGYIFYLYYPLVYSNIKRSQMPISYLDSISIPGDEKSQYFRVASDLYVKGYSDNIYTCIDDLYKNIKTKFSGEQQDYMTALLIGTFSLKQDSTYSKRLNEIIDSSLVYLKNPAYKDYITQSRDFYRLCNKQFSDDVLDNTKMKTYGKPDVISLRDVLNMYKGKSLYIDMWASWCGPCREDISKSAAVKEYLKSAGVEYLYFSVDRDEAAWLKASDEEKITQNQFMICDINNSPLAGFLSFNYVPFYVILDLGHRIKTSLGPRPCPENLNEIKAFISGIQSKITKF